MTYTTILVHLGEDEDCECRLRVATGLARRFGSHLDLLYVMPAPTSPIAGRGASVAFSREMGQAERDQAAELVRRLKHHWDDLDTHFHAAFGDAADLLSQRSVVADLVVVSQHESHGFGAWFEDQAADTLPALAACPVLVVPSGTTSTDIGHAVLAVWAPTREFARALREGLPLLRRSERAMVVCTGIDDQAAVTMEDVKDFLHRHQVTAAQVHDHGDLDHAGRAILDKARVFAADSIVLGADMSARWQDALFGGTVRYVLDHTHVPVLLTR